MTSTTQDSTTILNEKYTLLCADKCKFLNSIESVSKESKSIKKEICSILDLIAESKSEKELEEMNTDSDSEMTMDPFYTSFLNSNNQKRELEKMKKIQAEIKGFTQKTEKKLKRKSPKKIKTQSDISSDVTNTNVKA